MKAQEIFDRVAAHLLAQKKRALDSTGGCAYRTPDGLRCAVGGILPDELYSPKMEGHLAGDLLRKYPKIRKFFGAGARTILEVLQDVHDGYPAHRWPERLQVVADKYGLQFNPQEAQP